MGWAYFLFARPTCCSVSLAVPVTSTRSRVVWDAGLASLLSASAAGGVGGICAVADMQVSAANANTVLGMLARYGNEWGMRMN